MYYILFIFDAKNIKGILLNHLIVALCMYKINLTVLDLRALEKPFSNSVTNVQRMMKRTMISTDPSNILYTHRADNTFKIIVINGYNSNLVFPKN